MTYHHRVWFSIYYILHSFLLFHLFLSLHTAFFGLPLGGCYLFAFNSFHIFFNSFFHFQPNQIWFLHWLIRNCFSVCVIDFPPIGIDSFCHFSRILLLNWYLLCGFLSESLFTQCGFCTPVLSYTNKTAFVDMLKNLVLVFALCYWNIYKTIVWHLIKAVNKCIWQSNMTPLIYLVFFYQAFKAFTYFISAN